MTPKVGEVYMLDLGYGGKVRPIVIMSREDIQAPRAPATSKMANQYPTLFIDYRYPRGSNWQGVLSRGAVSVCLGAKSA
jgi:hypothetical protein